jgi:hypothetical protein
MLELMISHLRTDIYNCVATWNYRKRNDEVIIRLRECKLLLHWCDYQPFLKNYLPCSQSIIKEITLKKYNYSHEKMSGVERPNKLK